MTVSLSEKWQGLWWRIPVGGLFLYAAIRMFLKMAQYGGFVGVGCLLVAVASLTVMAIIFAPVLAQWLAENAFGSLAGLVFPERRFKRVPPIYGPAEARRMEGHATQALEAYEAILLEYPDDGRCYLAMMDIAWQDLQDAAMANNFYRRARAAVTDEAHLTEMRQAYEDFAPYLPEAGGYGG